MFRKHPEKISGLVNSFMRQHGLETPLLQRRLINSWDEIAGELTARYTTEKYIRNQTLFVKIQHPALRADLSMQKSLLVANLNNKVGAQIITDIRFI